MEGTPPDTTQAPPDNTTQAPPPDAAPSTEQLLKELVGHQQEQRAEIAALREELARGRTTPSPAAPAQIRSAEELLVERMAAIEQHPFYCPGCGRLYGYQRECTGTATAPHPPLDVISTDELKSGDTAQHTAAPGVAP